MKKRLLVCAMWWMPALAMAQPAQPIERQQWMDQISTVMPAAFCVQQTYFRQCFQVTIEECQSIAGGAVKACLKKFEPEIPATLKPAGDGRTWRRKVSECVAGDIEIALRSKRIEGDRCKDPKTWKQ